MLRQLANDLWVTQRRQRFLGLELGTRMTVVRLAGDELLVHSPVALDPHTRAELDRLGRVAYVVAPVSRCCATRSRGCLADPAAVSLRPRSEVDRRVMHVFRLLCCLGLGVALSAVTVAPARAALDHFTCYRARTASGTPKFVPRPDMQLEDRFGAMAIIFFAQERLCTPTDVNGADPAAPTHADHLAGYQTRNEVPHFARVHGLTVQNVLGTLTVDLTKPVRVLVPTAKSLAAPPPAPAPMVDHFTCYKVRLAAGAPKFVPVLGVALDDQLGALVVDVKKPKALCVPTDKNGESPGAENHPDHVMCYAIKRAQSSAAFATVTPVYVANQLGPATLTVRTPSELCVPSTIAP